MSLVGDAAVLVVTGRWHGRPGPVRWVARGAGGSATGAARHAARATSGATAFRDDEGPARVDPVGVAERSATGLRYADVGLVDGLPLLAVAVVRGGDAPQGVTGHHGVRHRGGLCIRRWPGVGHELHTWAYELRC